MKRTNFTQIYTYAQESAKTLQIWGEKRKNLVKTIPNWLKMSQSAKGGLKRKDCQNFGQELVSVDSEANNMV